MSASGAGYVAALLADDTSLVESFKIAFEPAELLAMAESQIRVLGRRVAVDSGRTLVEVGSDMVAAALVFDGLGIQL